MTTIDNSNVDHDGEVLKAGDGTDQNKLDEENPQGSVAVLMDARLDKKIPITVVTLLAAFVLGFRNDVQAATLVDIREHTNSSNSEISSVFIVSTIFGILSALFLVPLHNRFNTFLLMAVCSAVSGILMAAAPWSSNVFVFIGIISMIRAPQNVVSAGFMLSMAALWKKSGPFLQMSILAYTFGAAMAPLVTIPFLSKRLNDTYSTAVTVGADISYYTSTTFSSAMEDNNVNSTSNQNIPSTSNHSIPPATNETTTAVFQITDDTYMPNTETTVQYVYIISCATLIFESLLLFCAFNMLGRNPKYVLIKKDADKTATCATPDSGSNMISKMTTCLKRPPKFWYDLAVYIFTTLASLSVGGQVMGISSFIISLCYFELELTKETGAVILSVFTLSGLVCSAIQIVITIWVRAIHLAIIMSVLSVIISYTCVVCIKFHWLVIWVWSAILGASSLPTYGLLQTIGNEIVTADGKFQTYFFVGFQFGHLFIPSLIGFMFDTVGPMVFLYIIASVSLLLVTSLLCLKFLDCRLKKKSSASEHIHI